MKPLEGLTVIDLSHALSGPTCTQMLAQLGAEVIKVEPPVKGDDFRHYTEHAGLAGLSVPFAAVNAGKRSIALNLKFDVGPDVLWRLIDRGDILVENYKPGVLARLGFAFDAIAARNPRMIAASISGFGQSGPFRDWGAYDHIAQAMSGIALMNAGPEGPRKIGMPIIDSFSGYLAVIGILAALRKRDATGKGEHVDVAMLDAALKLIATSVSVESFTSQPPKGTGNRGYRMVATAEYYPCSDGWIALGANHQHQVEALLSVLGEPRLINDPRFADHAARVAHYDEIRTWLVNKLAGERAEPLEARLTAAGVPAAMLRDVGQIVAHPHVVERGLIEEGELPGSDRPLGIVGPGFGVEGVKTQMRIPVLDEHSGVILSELGYTEQEIANLRSKGAF